MVGVPGKSKGCNTCRRRKKGCDQKRPICGQCASSGYTCGGYSRDTTFIIHPASKAVQNAVFLSYAKPTPAALQRSVDRAAVESQCRSLFWDLYMPQGDASCRDAFILRCGHPMNWAEVFQDISDQDRSLEEAFSALSISRVGQGNKDVRLVHESAKFYGNALKELQGALFDPKRMYSNQVLMACMLLGLYEVLEGPAFNSRSWITHAKGAARLIQLRGPERHQEWDAHHPFLASRIPTIYASILQRKSTYLATEEWLTVPWATQKHKTYFDRMVDLATHVPSILEKFDLLCEKAVGIGEDLVQLLQQCEDLQTRLNQWRGGTKTGATPRSVKHQPADDDGYPFGTDLWFKNHLFVHARLVYYTCSLALAEVVEDILQTLDFQAHQLPDSLDRNGLKELCNADRYANNICRSVTYCLQPEMGAWGANIVNFPANRALAYYQTMGNTAATDWLSRAFQTAKRRGFHVENVFTQLLRAPQIKDAPSRLLKRESSSESTTDTTDAEHSPSSSQSWGSTSSTFVYEDPSKDYYVVTPNPG
ncbi:hypothetical protein A1O1_02227 [Capronia coronata CBS 617.96]|uniref:Zn(2)-C6 fungal-type domain-containing protein n=1 Tax=Capronia coronata CBS 617.96 TaxID=1182541 RepID=W9ZH95_9EURO|nr:uncharacterized protein A1O1_02227 [Capronia coronata CBS 617.96]EXJ93834.1 hypothetical protein A1O1_02227 [Capronia coronata CBS 617.96]